MGTAFRVGQADAAARYWPVAGPGYLHADPMHPVEVGRREADLSRSIFGRQRLLGHVPGSLVQCQDAPLFDAGRRRGQCERSSVGSDMCGRLCLWPGARLSLHPDQVLSCRRQLDGEVIRSHSRSGGHHEKQ